MVHPINKHKDQTKESRRCNWNLIYEENVITK